MLALTPVVDIMTLGQWHRGDDHASSALLMASSREQRGDNDGRPTSGNRIVTEKSGDLMQSRPSRPPRADDPDVIVVGGGGSGLAAAIEAATVGRRVLLLEKAPALGGTTGRVSVGSGGAQGNGPRDQGAVSADGRFVAFASDASNLVPATSVRIAAACFQRSAKGFSSMVAWTIRP